MPHHFSRHKYYENRLANSVEDPFDVRVFDFILTGPYDDEKISNLTNHVFDTFDSFRTGLQFMPDGTLRAELVDGPKPRFYAESVDRIEGHLTNSSPFPKANTSSIDLIEGRTAIFHYLVSQKDALTRLRILTTHFAVDQMTYRLLDRAIREFDFGFTSDRPKGSYLDWMDAYWEYAKSPAGGNELKFWSALDRKPFASAMRIASTESDVAQKKVCLRIPDDMLGALSAKSRRSDCRLVDVVAVAIGTAIGSVFGLDPVPLTWTAHGRHPLNGLGFSNTGGWLSNPHPLVMQPGTSSVAEAALSLRNTLMRLPNTGSSFAWIASFNGEAGASGIESELQSPFLLNVQESPKSDSRPRSIPASHPPVPAVEILPDRITPRFRMYFLIKLGRSLQINLEAAGKPTPAAERVMQLTSDLLFKYGVEDSDRL